MPLSFKIGSQVIVDRVKYKCNKIFKILKQINREIKMGIKIQGEVKGGLHL